MIPVVLGRVKRFLLYGDHEEGDVFATGGEIEIVQVGFLLCISVVCCMLCCKVVSAA